MWFSWWFNMKVVANFNKIYVSSEHSFKFSITQILGGPLKFPKDLQVLGKCLERKINKFWNHSKYTQKIFQTQILIPPKIQTHFCTETLWYPCLPHANLCIFHLHTNSESPGTVHTPGRFVKKKQNCVVQCVKNFHLFMVVLKKKKTTRLVLKEK